MGRKASGTSAAAAAARKTAPKAAFSSGASITVDLSKAFDLHSTYCVLLGVKTFHPF